MMKKIIFNNKKKTLLILLFAGIVVFYFIPKKNINSDKEYSWFKVSEKVATLSVHKYGKMTTGNNISVTAPFNGKILAVYYNLGDKVIKGQKLVLLSTDEVIKKLHESKSDYLKKQEEYEKLLNWNNGVDVQKAKQSLIDAKRQHQISIEKLQNDTYLFNLGIISRDELNQQKETVEQNKLGINYAKYTLQETLKQGDESNLLMSKLALQDALSEFKNFEKKLNNAVIMSPSTGVAIQPKQSGDKSSSSFEAVVGETVIENQNILTIGDSENLQVIGSLTQDEVNQILPGMKVNITCDAFKGVIFTGKIIFVSKLAKDLEASPVFSFTVAVNNIPKKYKPYMRFGFMVNINLEIYRNNNALVIPIDSLFEENEKFYVWYKKNNKVVKKYVIAGPTLPDGIVIEKGLKVDDVIRVNHS